MTFLFKCFHNILERHKRDKVYASASKKFDEHQRGIDVTSEALKAKETANATAVNHAVLVLKANQKHKKHRADLVRLLAEKRRLEGLRKRVDTDARNLNAQRDLLENYHSTHGQLQQNKVIENYAKELSINPDSVIRSFDATRELMDGMQEVTDVRDDSMQFTLTDEPDEADVDDEISDLLCGDPLMDDTQLEFAAATHRHMEPKPFDTVKALRELDDMSALNASNPHDDADDPPTMLLRQAIALDMS